MILLYCTDTLSLYLSSRLLGWNSDIILVLCGEQLLKNFQERFPDLVFPEVPARGDLDLNEVLRAPYFFN